MKPGVRILVLELLTTTRRRVPDRAELIVNNKPRDTMNTTPPTLTGLLRAAIAQTQEQRLREAAAERILNRLDTARGRSESQLTAARTAGRV